MHCVLSQAFKDTIELAVLTGHLRASAMLCCVNRVHRKTLAARLH